MSITAVFPEQRDAWTSGSLPPPQLLSEDVWAIAVPIPNGTIPYTLCYALRSRDGVHLIDPGWDHPASTGALAAGLRELGFGIDEVRSTIATHFHPDHMGAVGALRARSGAVVRYSAVEHRVLAQETAPAATDQDEYRERLASWGVPPDRWTDLIASFDRAALITPAAPDELLSDGDQLPVTSSSLRVIATPGHTGGHICLVDEDRGLLFSGDHVLPGIASGLGIGALPGSDPIGSYLASLDRLAPYDAMTVLPGHEYAFRGLAERRAALTEHHVRRTREVAGLIPLLGEASVWEYASHLTWTAGWSGLTGYWLHSALRQTEMHRDFVLSGSAAARLSPPPDQSSRA